MQMAAYFPEVRARIFFNFVGRTPRATVYHGVQCPFVKGNVDGFVGNPSHVAYVHELPFYSLYIGVAFGHEVDDGGGEVDAELPFVAPRCKFDRNDLDRRLVSGATKQARY
jgi:hypothetical protein